ncbi:hypothetical protein ACFL3H_04900 [Gemmatimonadota bacterium]
MIRSEIDGVPLVRTEGGPKYHKPLFEIETDLFLGIEDGEPAWQIFDETVRNLTIHPDGRMYFMFSTRSYDSEILSVSPKGELLTRFGGTGSGPGEYNRVGTIKWSVLGEELLISDTNLRRVSRFTAEGEFLGLVGSPGDPDRWLRFNRISDHRYLGFSEVRRSQGQYWIHGGTYVLLDEQLHHERDLFDIQDYRMGVVTKDTGLGGRPGSLGIPYTRGDRAIPYPDSRILLGSPASKRLTILSLEGEPLFYIERDWPDNRPPRRDYNQYRRNYRTHPSVRMQNVAIPRHEPAFDRVYTDEQGVIWVQSYVSPMEWMRGKRPTYEVFGPDGVWLGTVDFKNSVYLIQGGHAYFITQPEGGDGGPHLERKVLIPLVPELQDR